MSAKTLLVAFLLVGFSSAVWAQTRTGRLSGVVRDTTSGALPGVTVRLEGEALIASQTALTNQAGAYRFLVIPPGTYTIRFGLSGFKTVVYQGVRVGIGKNTAINVILELAAVAESITVVGESPMVDTKTTVIGASFDKEVLQAVPSARDVWSLLEHQAPGVTTDRLDVGGSEAGLQAVYSARGTSWVQNSYYLNGINVTCPASLGASGYYYDYDSFEEIQVETGSHAASVNAPGVTMNMVTKAGGNQFRGGASFYYQDDGTQWDNLTPELEARGAGRGVKFDYFSDINAQIGGPIVEDRSNFYFSWRDQRVHRLVAGYPEVESTDMWQFLIKNQTQVNTNHRVGIEWHHMSYFKPARGAAANRRPEATWIEDDTFDIIQAEWTATWSENILLDTRFSHLKVWFPLLLRPDVTSQAAFDAGTRVFSGARPLERRNDRRRYALKSDLTIYQNNWAGAAHKWKLGFEYGHSPIENFGTSIDDLFIYTFNGRPDRVDLYNTPRMQRQAVDQISFFVDDIINPGNRATVKAGLRMDSYEGYLPEQSSPAGSWVSERSFPERRNIVDLTSFAPRLGLILDLDGSGKTALKASWGRYYHQFPTTWPNFANQNGPLADTYSWNDTNRDGQFQDGEQGKLLARGIAADNLVDPDLKHPYTDEITLGVEKELGQDLAVTGTFAYRKGHRLQESVDIGIPYSAYSPVTVTDPGPDGLPGTGDDGGPMTVFELDPATLGKNQRMLTNPTVTLPDGTKIPNESEFVGFELILQKRFSNYWSALLSYAYNDAEGISNGDFELGIVGGIFDNPNRLINSRGKLFWDRTHQLKLLGSYYAPYGIRISGVLRYQTGQPLTRTFNVIGLTQGTFSVLAVPVGSERLPNVLTGDLTCAKSFELPRGMLTGEATFFNIANANTVTGIITGSGPSFGNVTNFLSPRIFRFGFRYVF